MIRIELKNGNVCKWKKRSYTDYMYDGKFFIIIQKHQWVGFYNLDEVTEIVVT